MKLVLAIPLLISCGKEDASPDGIWKVTVSNEDSFCDDALAYANVPGSTGMDDVCGTDCEGVPERVSRNYRYELYFDGESAEIRIDGQSFASGTLSGCDLNYESPVWLQKRGDGNVQWSVSGLDTTVQGSVDCGLPANLDWVGYEVITVIESDDPDLSPGCSYRMATVGEYVGKGD